MPENPLVGNGIPGALPGGLIVGTVVAGGLTVGGVVAGSAIVEEVVAGGFNVGFVFVFVVEVVAAVVGDIVDGNNVPPSWSISVSASSSSLAACTVNTLTPKMFKLFIPFKKKLS